jgi:hypothetical protein
MIRKSKLKLGVSVTVLILEWKKRGDGGRTITKVFYVESSIVGIPCNQTAWALSPTGKSAAQFITTKEGLTVFSPLDMSDAESVERFRGEMTSWLGHESSKEQSTMSTRASKSFFNDEFEERTTDPWFLLSTFYYGLMDLYSQVRTGAVTVEDAGRLLAEGFDELKANGVPAIEPKLQALADAGDDYDDPWYYYALNMATATHAAAKSFDLTKKEGRTLSAETLKSIQLMHDSMSEAHCKAVDLGADCKCMKDAEEETEEDESSKSAALEAEQSSLIEQLEEALQAAEEAAKALELERATSLVAVEMLEEFSLQPLPRAGHGESAS